MQNQKNGTCWDRHSKISIIYLNDLYCIGDIIYLPMNNSQTNPIRWPEIIKKVDGSSMATTNNHHLQKVIQQKAYRQSLEHQIHENHGQQTANRN